MCIERTAAFSGVAMAEVNKMNHVLSSLIVSSLPLYLVVPGSKTPSPVRSSIFLAPKQCQGRVSQRQRLFVPADTGAGAVGGPAIQAK